MILSSSLHVRVFAKLFVFFPTDIEPLCLIQIEPEKVAELARAGLTIRGRIPGHGGAPSVPSFFLPAALLPFPSPPLKSRPP